MIIAGVGSRKTTPNIIADMIKIGEFCAKNNITIRSGHATGADQAFEQGAQQNLTAYLPWSGFEKDFISKAKLITYKSNPETIELTKKYCPHYFNLAHSHKLLHERNIWQVLSPTLNEPVDAVICWTEGGKVVGGTATAIRCAMDNSIRVINMGEKQNDLGLVLRWIENRLWDYNDR